MSKLTKNVPCDFHEEFLWLYCIALMKQDWIEDYKIIVAMDTNDVHNFEACNTGFNASVFFSGAKLLIG